MQTQIDLAAFSNFALSTFDYSEHFEEDAFAVTFDGARIYVERKRSYFLLDVQGVTHRLPRY